VDGFEVRNPGGFQATTVGWFDIRTPGCFHQNMQFNLPGAF
jgi:hypothetical protein